MIIIIASLFDPRCAGGGRANLWLHSVGAILISLTLAPDWRIFIGWCLIDADLITNFPRCREWESVKQGLEIAAYRVGLFGLYSFFVFFGL